LVGFNAKEECRKYCDGLTEKIEKIKANADSEVEKILKTVNEINRTTIPDILRNYVKKITIPNNVISIGMLAFSECESLTSITIHDSVTSIGDYAFSFCKSLTSITISNNVTSIGENAFMRCESLTSITIPNSVTSIGTETFWLCESLKEVIFKGKTLDEVKRMENYPFGIEDESIIKCV
jgi:hypothetical protein